MSTSYPRTEAYLRRYTRWMRFFPRHFQDRFSGEIIQTLRDHLEYLEKEGDASLVRDAFYGAVAEIPMAALRERLRSPMDTSSLFASSGITGWRTYSYVFFLLLGLAVFGSFAEMPVLATVATVLALSSVVGMTLARTGRPSLTLLVFLVILGGSILAANLAGYLYVLPGGPDSWSVFWDGLTGTIAGYLVLVWFQLNSSYYSRTFLAGLTPAKLRELKEANRRKRLASYRVAGALAGTFLVANLVGLYDPVTATPLSVPVHQVARDQNMYYALESLPLPAEFGYTNGGSTVLTTEAPSTSERVPGYLNGTRAWNQGEVDSILQASATGRIRFAQASVLSGYQIPGLEMTSDDPIQHVQPFSYPQSGRYGQAANLVLLSAANDLRSGRTQAATDQIASVLRVYSAVDASNQTLIGHLSAIGLAKNSLSVISASEIALGQKEKSTLLSLLPTRQDIWANSQRSLTWEALGYLDGLQRGGRDSLQPLLLMPYNFQLNRTVRLYWESEKKSIQATPDICGQPLTPPDTARRSLYDLSDYLSYNGIGKRLATISDMGTSVHAGDCEVMETLEKVRGELL